MPLPSSSKGISGSGGTSVERGCPFLIFELGTKLFAVGLGNVREVAFMASLSQPSGLPSVLAGFLNVAQRTVPVVHIDRLLGVSMSDYSLYTQILILRYETG